MKFVTNSFLEFFKKLEKNNNKEWFEKNRGKYELNVLEPAKEFVLIAGEKNREFIPNIKAIPRIDKSIFRLHRDVRFSKNKQPYKTNMGIFFWEGESKRMECTGFYFHVEPKMFFLGVGVYLFSPEYLKKYRQAIVKPSIAIELDSIIRNLIKTNEFEIGGKYYKKVPRGFDREYQYANYLLFNGLYIGTKKLDTKILLSKNNQLEYIIEVFKKLSPLHNWLMENIY